MQAMGQPSCSSSLTSSPQLRNSENQSLASVNSGCGSFANHSSTPGEFDLAAVKMKSDLLERGKSAGFIGSAATLYRFVGVLKKRSRDLHSDPCSLHAETIVITVCQQPLIDKGGSDESKRNRKPILLIVLSLFAQHQGDFQAFKCCHIKSTIRWDR